MAEHLFKTDGCNTLSLVPTLITRGSTFIKNRLIDQPRDDNTRPRIHDQLSIKRRSADDNRIQQTTDPPPPPPATTYNCDREEDEGSSGQLTGLALARIQHRAKKSATNDTGANTSQLRLQERRGSNPDRSTRSTGDDSTSHMTSEMTTSNRETAFRTIERPSSSWASKSGRRPNFTESGWEVEDEDFVDCSRLEKMEINESNSYTVRRSSVNEASCHSSSFSSSSSHGKSCLSLPTGHPETLMRRASDSSRARSYKEAAKELRREEGLVAGSHKKKEESHSNGGANNNSHITSMTNGELARMRAVTRLSHATVHPQLPSESASAIGSSNRHLPRKLDPLPPVSQVIGSDRGLEEEEYEYEEEEEEEEEVGIARQQQHWYKCSARVNGGGVEEAPLRRRGSREQQESSSAIFFSDSNVAEKNIIPKPKLKPIARK